MPHKVGNGAILGIVSEDGVPSQKRITLMDRSDLSIVRRAMSDEYGAYAFTGLNPDTNDYLLFTVDDDGAEKKAAIIYDCIKPIPAHQGGFFWGNWYQASMAKEPICSIIMPTDSGVTAQQSMSYGAGIGPVEKSGISVILNEESITPAAASLPRASLGNASFRRVPLNKGNLLSKSNGFTYSFEWVIDLSAPMASDPTISMVRFFLEGTDYYYKDALFMVSYLVASKKIIIYRQDNPNISVGYQNPNSGGLVVATEYVLPLEMQDKVLHVSGSVEYGVSASLYINGVQVSTASLLGTNTSISSSRATGVYFLMGSQDASPPDRAVFTNHTTLSSSLACLYASKMTEAEALYLYKSLFIDRLPIATGYLKAVIEDYPYYVYRLHDETESGVLIDSLQPLNLTDTACSKALPTIMPKNSSSIVVGGSGIQFDGGGSIRRDTFGSPKSNNFITVDFIAKPDSASKSSIQTIIRHAASNGVSFFEVRRKAVTGEWGLQWRESNLDVIVYFNHVIDTTEIKHYAFSINKINKTAKLYVNAALIETVALSTQIPMQKTGSIIGNEFLYLGGIAAGNLLSVTQPYFGYLAEVAMYPTELSLERIKTHYDARLVI